MIKREFMRFMATSPTTLKLRIPPSVAGTDSLPNSCFSFSLSLSLSLSHPTLQCDNGLSFDPNTAKSIWMEVYLQALWKRFSTLAKRETHDKKCLAFLPVDVVI
jgi:hypothetical protein